MTLTLEGISNEHVMIQGGLEKAPSVLMHDSCYDTLLVLRSYPEAPYVVVIDKLERPVGVVKREQFFFRMNSPVGIDLFYSEKITKLMSPIKELA